VDPQPWRHPPKIGMCRNGCGGRPGHRRAAKSHERLLVCTGKEGEYAAQIAVRLDQRQDCENPIARRNRRQTDHPCATRYRQPYLPTDPRRNQAAFVRRFRDGPFLTPAVCPRRLMVAATSAHIACNRATARCIASTSAAVVSSLPLLHIPLKAAPSSMTIVS